MSGKTTDSPTRGRPRRSPARQEAMRGAILDAARALFFEEGVQSVSIRKIMRQVGSAPMNFYEYFENKQALLRALWGEFFVDVFAQCEAAAAREAAPLPKARAFLAAYARYWFVHPDHFRLVFLVEDRLVDPVDQYYVDSALIRARFEALGQWIGEAGAASDAAGDKVELRAQAVLAAIHGLLLAQITISEYPWQPFEAMLDEILTAFLGA